MADPGSIPHGYRWALKHPVVRQLWLATAVSVVGDYIGQGALLLLAFDRTGGLTLGSAALFGVQAIPALLSGAFAGSWLDQIPRGRALVGLQLLGAITIAFPVLVPGLLPIYASAAMLGAIRTASTSVRSAAMAEGVPDDHRGPLIALLGSTEQSAQVLGFLTGASLSVAVGASFALIADSVSFLIGAAMLSTIMFAAPQERERRPRLTAGIRDIFSDPVLRLLAPLVWVTGTVGALPEALAPGVAGAASIWTPFVLAAAPTGQAVTMLLIGRTKIIGRPSAQLIHLAWLALALGLAALGRSPGWFVAANFLVGSGVAWLIGPQLTFVRLAPNERMAQITGTMVAILIAAESIGTPIFGAIADAASVATAYRVAGGLVLVTAIVGWIAKDRVPAAQQLDENPPEGSVTPPSPPM